MCPALINSATLEWIKETQRTRAVITFVKTIDLFPSGLYKENSGNDLMELVRGYTFISPYQRNKSLLSNSNTRGENMLLEKQLAGFNDNLYKGNYVHERDAGT
ncbi:hypothetical protein MAR_037540 [Mya arenaria]|uniref:Uncharacterized protein n=1 Tax=Mya arenaria TaxID=6604 RepID=A0ABY7FT18_MYAAR|nr:hypothetical protein MAR_037540 [Mya arenaria]